jgi:2-iminobutanoate/2-iminopropanoate deaminase
MPRRKIETAARPQPIGAYSQGVRGGDFIFVSGQGPFDPGSGETCGDTIEEQTARALGNIKAVLEAGGASMADVVKVTAHLSDMSLFERYNRVYSNYFAEPRPARTIDAIAYVRPK